MLVGHLGAGLAAKAAAPRVGLGTLMAAAVLLDIVLWLFVAMHIEGASVPGYAITTVIVLDLMLTGSGRSLNTIAVRQDPAVTREALAEFARRYLRRELCMQLIVRP